MLCVFIVRGLLKTSKPSSRVPVLVNAFLQLPSPILTSTSNYAHVRIYVGSGRRVGNFLNKAQFLLSIIRRPCGRSGVCRILHRLEGDLLNQTIFGHF